MKNHCISCKKPIEYVRGYCEECGAERIQKKIEKISNRRIAKLQNTLQYSLGRVKDLADRRYWATSHSGCFRATFGKGETKEHRDKKYERWCHHRSLGRKVFCELILASGLRPDLIVIDKGFIFIEEIIVSEKKSSIERKKREYPFEVRTIE